MLIIKHALKTIKDSSDKYNGQLRWMRVGVITYNDLWNPTCRMCNTARCATEVLQYDVAEQPTMTPFLVLTLVKRTTVGCA